MTSVLRTLQAEWNSLVPAAQAQGVRRVRMLNAPLETIAYRREKLEWLRAQLSSTTSVGASFDMLTFGVEIEVIMPTTMSQSTLARLITDAGVSCHVEMYNHETRQGWWKTVTDGSLGDYRRACEVVSPPLRGEAGFAQLRKVCDTLVANRVKVNRRCGFHVHVGAASESVQFFKNLVLTYSSAEDTIDSFMAPSRRGPHAGNGFCNSLKTRVNQSALAVATTVDAVARAISQTPGRANVRDSSRYCKLNLKSYWQHGTVEFRQHQGTVEAHKAENWVKFCLRMVLSARVAAKDATTLEQLMAAVEATDTERGYFAARVTYFNRGSNQS